MAIQQVQSLSHWNYFLLLEDDLLKISRYIEFTQENFQVYSLELTRVLFAASSEVDVVAKLFCNTNTGKKNIDGYRKHIMSAHPNFCKVEVLLPRYGLSLRPWSEWGENEKNPLWWKANNNVKHERNVNYSQANLKNALNSVAGLFVMLLYFYRQEAEGGVLIPDPILFKPGVPFKLDMMMRDDSFTQSYTFDYEPE